LRKIQLEHQEASAMDNKKTEKKLNENEEDEGKTMR
jgi:hypothetical protein